METEKNKTEILAVDRKVLTGEVEEWYQNVSLEDAEVFIRSNLQSAFRSVIATGFYLKHMDAAAALDEGTHEPESGTKQPGTSQQNTEEAKPVLDAAFYVALDQKVDKILKALDEKTATEKNEEKDPMDEAIKALEGTKDEDLEKNEKQEEAKVVPAEEMDDTSSEGMDKAVAASILKAMRPTVAAIQDAAQRKAVSDALIKAVTAKDTANDIDAILKASRANAKKAADVNPVMTVEQCQAAYDARNPHKRKENQ